MNGNIQAHNHDCVDFSGMPKGAGALGDVYRGQLTYYKLALLPTVIMSIEDVAKAAKYDIRNDAEYSGYDGH
jgi:hypothetical protein